MSEEQIETFQRHSRNSGYDVNIDYSCWENVAYVISEIYRIALYRDP